MKSKMRSRSIGLLQSHSKALIDYEKVEKYLMSERLLDENNEPDVTLFDVTMYNNKKTLKIAY